jgi:hypothetical protein
MTDEKFSHEPDPAPKRATGARTSAGLVVPGLTRAFKGPQPLFVERVYLNAPLVGNPDGEFLPTVLPGISELLPSIFPPALTTLPLGYPVPAVFPTPDLLPPAIEVTPTPNKCELLELNIEAASKTFLKTELPPLETDRKPTDLWKEAKTLGWHVDGRLTKDDVDTGAGIGVRFFFRVYVRLKGDPKHMRLRQFIRGVVYAGGKWYVRTGAGKADFAQTTDTDPDKPPEAKFIEETYPAGSPYTAEGSRLRPFKEYWDAPGPTRPRGINLGEHLQPGNIYKVRFHFRQMAECLTDGSKLETPAWLVAFDMRWNPLSGTGSLEFKSPKSPGFSAVINRAGSMFAGNPPDLLRE